MKELNWKIAWFVVGTVLGTLAVLAVGVVAVIYSGVYDVAASEGHYRPVAWALETTMERSVRERAAGVPRPPPVDSSQLMTGFHHFDAMCATCHGAPGRERSEIGKGLLPEPPALSEAADQWTDRELFWIAKHGIKMSGMPAFGPTHDDEALWGIVAVVRRLPGMTAERYERYRELAGRSAAEGGHGHDHQHGHE